MLWNHETISWPGALAVAVALAVGLTACGSDSTERTQTAGGTESGDVESVAPRPTAERAGGAGAVPVSDTGRPGGSADEPEPEPVESSSVEHVTFGDAERVFRDGEYEEAAELFEAYAERRPENPWGPYMVGISAWRAGDHERAEAALRRTIEVDPDHEKGLLNLARVLLERREASDALDPVERVVDLKPQMGEGWRVLGNAYSELGMAEQAVEAYREALVLDHRDAWTMNNLGLLMIREGRYEEALPPLARATTLRPDVAIFQNNLGTALERSGHLAEAVDAFQAALAADPEYEKSRVSLERVELRLPKSAQEPLDLAELADGFAAELDRWKERSVEVDESDVDGSETSEEVDGSETPEASERRADPDTSSAAGPDTMSAPDTVGAPDTSGVHRPHGSADAPEPHGQADSHGYGC